MREPRIENKYNLKLSDIKYLEVADRSKICHPPFLRNDVMKSWCISRVIGSKEAVKACAENEFFLGVYDEPQDGQLIYLNIYSYGGMCSYDFENFYDYREIENEQDLETQEELLKVLNRLLDDGIFKINKNK